MAPFTDHALGQQLVLLIQQSGESAFEAGAVSRRLQAQLQDLLGADTSLLIPLRDLLQRPAFRQLFNLGSQGQVLHARDALLQDLAQVYSPAVLGRLDAVLRGCLNLPAEGATTWSQPAAWGSIHQSAGSRYPYAPPEPAPASSAPPPHPTVVTIPANQQGPTTIVIALLALICGALVMALAGVLITGRNNTVNTPAPPSQPSQPNTPSTPTPRTEPPPAPTPEAAPLPVASDQWQACVDRSDTDGQPPQPGETWWPVVGPGNALAAARQHCRSDAFINRSGNAQIASFRDRDTATTFAEQLSADSSHPYTFWVGEASER